MNITICDGGRQIFRQASSRFIFGLSERPPSSLFIIDENSLWDELNIKTKRVACQEEKGTMSFKV
jgi:hypothetical protein